MVLITVYMRDNEIISEETITCTLLYTILFLNLLVRHPKCIGSENV